MSTPTGVSGHRRLGVGLVVACFGCGALVAAGAPVAVADTQPVVYVGIDRTDAAVVPFNPMTSTDATAASTPLSVQRHWNFGMALADSGSLTDATISATSARTFVNPDHPSAVPPPYTAGPATVVGGGAPLNTRDYGFESAYAIDTAAPGFSASRTVSPLVIPVGGATQLLTVTFTMPDSTYGGMGLIVGEVGDAATTWTYDGITPASAPVSVDRNGTWSVAVGVTNPVAGQTYTLTFTGHVPNTTGQPLALKPRVGFLASNAESALPDATAQKSYAMDDPVLQGTATFTFDSADPTRNYTIRAGTNHSFGVDYRSGQAAVPYEWPSNGNFVIGSGAAVGEKVMYWGAQWSIQQVELYLGVPPKAFKGFANSPAGAASCGQAWSTTPGNSASPPATVPEYMAVIGTSAITQNGSTIAGNIAAIIIVKTDPGYASNTGHAGTGTVIEVIPCS